VTNYTYVGSELELFSWASNWKAYLGRLMRPYLGNEVLEVGAGIGTTTDSLCKGLQRRWVCLEPDQVLARTLSQRITEGRLPECCEVKVGTLPELNRRDTFDTIAYVDVLEHIEDDQTEMRLAADHLREGGTLVVLAPAHQWLFAPFDEALGHHRRYDLNGLSRIMPKDLKCIRLSYLDCVGLLASLGNRFFLRSSIPSRRQIALWDGVMVPLSRSLDPLLRYSIGKSVLGVWRKISSGPNG
jgi:SAM-dependent methyltransferase